MKEYRFVDNVPGRWIAAGELVQDWVFWFVSIINKSSAVVTEYRVVGANDTGIICKPTNVPLHEATEVTIAKNLKVFVPDEYTGYPGRKWVYDAQEEQWECFFSLDKEGVLPIPGRPINVSMTVSKTQDGSCLATAIINERPYQQRFFDVEKAMIACDFMLMAHARDELTRSYALYTACLKFPHNPKHPKSALTMKFKFAYDGLKSVIKDDVIKPYLVFNQSDKG